MRISIITPFYKGNQFMEQYWSMIDECTREFCDANLENMVEVIIINDSPDVEVLEPKIIFHTNVNFTVISNDINSGIHQSRINGLLNSNYEYVLLLDQDDIITHNYLVSQSTFLKDEQYDIVLCNGYFELADRKEKIYLDEKSQKYAIKEWCHIMIRDFIVSPGQCLIKKSSIPIAWIENCMHSNGADDYLLWLLSFEENLKYVSNFDFLYTHSYNESNLSKDEEKMNSSTIEMLTILNNPEIYNMANYRLLKRRIDFKRRLKKKNYKTVIDIIVNMEIFIINVNYKLRWRGYTVGNDEY